MADLLRRMGRAIPTVAGIDFLVSRLERPAEVGEEGPVGHVVASLVHLANAVRNGAHGSRMARGVPDIDRSFPSWSVAPEKGPIDVRRTFDIGEIGRLIGPRLEGPLAAETYPRLLPLALRAWGLEDGPFIEAVRRAVAALPAGTGRDGLLDDFLALEPLPDWDRHDAVMTWGILNPFGPTKVQICLVAVDASTAALVYTLHNPFGPVCLLLGTMRAGKAGAVGGLLLELAERFHLGDEPLLRGLPQWVVTRSESGLSDEDAGISVTRCV